MTKLCPRGKAAAKRKFMVYPSAYANAYASKICAGKIKDPSGVKRKDFRGPKPMKQGDMVNVKKFNPGALSTISPQDKQGPMLPGEDERIFRGISPFYEKTGEAVSDSQASVKRERLGADIDTKFGTFGAEVGKGSTMFPGGAELKEKTGQLRYNKTIPINERTKFDISGGVGERRSKYSGYDESKQKTNTYNIGGRLTYELGKKSGGVVKEGKFKYVKGGFEEGNYQDYVNELIK